ncbi:MAG: site-specific integrase [Ruminiclostridium sp.]|nr:site-specific integrase [Ruminiclostridium sp.]
MPRRGENIFKRKDGRWEARYIHHYENGKAKYRFIYGHSYTEAKQKMLAERTVQCGVDIHATKRIVNFEALASIWLANIKSNVKESTYTRYYRDVSKYLNPRIGKRQVTKMDIGDINELVKKLLQCGGTTGHSLSPKTTIDIMSVFKRIWIFGLKNGYCRTDISDVKLPKKPHNQAETLPCNVRDIISSELNASCDTATVGIVITLFTGLRIGEICGLRWEDIDIDEKVITVKRTIQRIPDLSPNAAKKTKVIISSPKTESSNRQIPIPTFMINFLQRHRCRKSCYVLTGTEKYIEPHQCYMEYKKYMKNHDLSDYKFHTLRHTFATKCVETGFDTKSLSEILGHSDVKTTLSIYVHPTMEMKRKQMELLCPTNS